MKMQAQFIISIRPDNTVTVIKKSLDGQIQVAVAQCGNLGDNILSAGQAAGMTAFDTARAAHDKGINPVDVGAADLFEPRSRANRFQKPIM